MLARVAPAFENAKQRANTQADREALKSLQEYYYGLQMLRYRPAFIRAGMSQNLCGRRRRLIALYRRSKRITRGRLS